jgi:sec-independent protein translocase protein TatC
LKTLEETRMPLGDHLAELRTRLVRVLVAIAVLAGLGWWQATAIYGWLMRPVLLALPPGSDALVFTSAIEEINVLLKVGLYAGVCLATPIALYQLWGFVAPGLHATERRLAGPFVLGGTLAFAAGSLFCYLAMLPPMFQFLLRNAGQLEREHDLELLELREQRSLAALRAGDGARAEREARLALEAWSAQPVLRGAAASIRPSDGRRELFARLEGAGRLLDATATLVPPETAAAAFAEHGTAVDAWNAGDLEEAERACDQALSTLGASAAPLSAALAAVWELERAWASGRAQLAASRWTRPMLAMGSQLDLVLLLMLATGAVFELPLLLAVLGMAGLVSSAFLMRYQRHAVVVCVALAAVITPTSDVFNLALMCGPMLVCFELGVLAVWVIERRRARREAAAA